MLTKPSSTHDQFAYQAGFTLTELMITLSMVTILTTMALPAFSSMLEENRIVSKVYELVAQLNYAKNVAVTSNKQVVLCKSSDGAYCDGGASWAEGWIIFADTSRNREREDDEPLVRVKQVSDKSNLDFRAFGSDDYVAFQPTGMLKMGNGTFTFCPKNNEIPPRAVIISKTGRVRISRTKVNGDSLECP